MAQKQGKTRSRGSIEWLDKNKCRLVVAERIEGTDKYKKHYRTLHTSSKRDADRALAAFIVEVENGQHIKPKEKKVMQQAIRVPDRKTFAGLVDYWLQEREAGFSDKTAYRFRELLDSRIIPALGTIPLDEISVQHLDEFYATLGKDGVRKDGKPGGLSPTTIKHHHRLLNMIFKFGEKKDLIHKNPAPLAEKIPVKKKRIDFYDNNEIEQLFEFLKKEPFIYQLAVTMAIATGARRGELFGLTWSDIDLENAVIKINKAVGYIPRKGTYVKDPKNDYSVRTIEIPSWVLSLLKKHRTQQRWIAQQMGNLYQGESYVFVGESGRKMHPDTISSWFPEFLRKHELKPIKFHGLRHSAASYFISRGMDVESVREVLGHSSSTTTLKFYSHAYKTAQKQAASHMEELNPDRKKKA